MRSHPAILSVSPFEDALELAQRAMHRPELWDAFLRTLPRRDADSSADTLDSAATRPGAETDTSHLTLTQRLAGAPR
jgi:hypothetical protein